MFLSCACFAWRLGARVIFIYFVSVLLNVNGELWLIETTLIQEIIKIVDDQDDVHFYEKDYIN